MVRVVKSFVLVCITAVFIGDSMIAAPVPANASDAPLSFVPEQSPIVIHVKGIERVRGRVKAMVAAALPDFAGVAAGAVDNMFGQAFEGRKLTGLSPNGPLFLAFLEMPTPGESDPNIAIIARITKYSEFRDGFLKADEKASLKSVAEGIDQVELNGSDTTFIVDRKDFAILTPKKESAEALAKGYKGMDGQLSKELATKLLDNDIGIYVNMAMVNKEFADQIRQGRDLIMSAMDQAPGMEKGQADMVKQVYGGVFNGITDSRAMVVAADFRPDGAMLYFQSVVGPETNSATFLKNQKPVAFDKLGTLPGGQMMYSAYEMSAEAMKSFTGMMQGLSAAEGDAKKAIESALNQIAAARGGAAYGANNYPVAGLNFQSFEDPAKALAGAVAMYRAMGEGGGFMGGIIQGKPEIKVDAEEFRGIKLTSVKLAYDLEKMAEMVPGGGEAMKAYFKKIIGEELRVWMGVDGKRLINVIAKDWPAAKAKLEMFFDDKSSLGAMPAYQATRKQLSPTASMLYLLDAGPYTSAMLESMLTMFKAMPVLPIQLPDAIKPVKSEPAFIGAAVVLSPDRGGFELFVPVTAVKEIHKVVMQLFMGN